MLTFRVAALVIATLAATAPVAAQSSSAPISHVEVASNVMWIMGIREKITFCPEWVQAEPKLFAVGAESTKSIAQLRYLADAVLNYTSRQPRRPSWPTDKGSWWATDPDGRRSFRPMVSDAGDANLAIYDLGGLRLAVYWSSRR